MRRVLLCCLLAAPATGLPAVLNGQATATPVCPDSLGRSMAFLRGRWEGRSYSIAGTDTTLDATMTVRSEPLFGSCAIEERWHAVRNGRTLFTAAVVRSYDAPTQRWQVHYVDDQLNSQVYEGRWEGGEWRFFRTRMEGSAPIVVRLTWRRTEGGYEQLIERSRDAGTTWTLGGFVRYRPSGG